MDTNTYHLAALTKFNCKHFVEKFHVGILCCLKRTVFDCIEVAESYSWKWMTLRKNRDRFLEDDILVSDTNIVELPEFSRKETN